MNGDHLYASEFMRRYAAMSEVKKAELIGGTVYMPSPIRLEQHGEPDSLIQTWLGTYAIATAGVRSATNVTVRLGPDDVLQPDALMRLVPECGGHARVDASGYLSGPPELIVEIAASSVSIDLHEKHQTVRRFGVSEYLVWRTEEGALDWWHLENDQFVSLTENQDPDPDQKVLRSRVFPGLWLNTDALIKRNGAGVLATLKDGLNSLEYKDFTNGLNTETP